jgi:fructose-1,6-bisphosphatase I
VAARKTAFARESIWLWSPIAKTLLCFSNFKRASSQRPAQRQDFVLTSLTSFLDQRPAALLPPKLRDLIVAVAEACKVIGAAVNASAINGTQGALAQENVQGEVQKQLDVMANDIMLEAERWKGTVVALASEEMDEFYPLPETGGDYLLVFDPIDGSSNVDVNGVVGTIFSIQKTDKVVADITEADFFKPGRLQAAAGYAIYGPQTTLLFSIGDGVYAFSLDGTSGEWLLTSERLSIPAKTKEFAINVSNQRHWVAPLQRYIDECLAGETGPRGFNFNMRWLASMVGDVHRILTRGGIFLYPTDSRKGMQNGKLRLLYEANPIAFLIEQAGGAATDGVNAILDLTPNALHQRVGVVLGSREEVERVASYLKA